MDNTLPELDALSLQRPQADLFDRYMALHSQQASYRRRASSSDPSESTSRRISDSSRTSTTSPTTGASPLSTSPPSFSLATNLTPPTNAESSPLDTDHALYEVNHAIKSTLTDFLNCDAVKCDAKWRMWCQARLMDAELELKRQRRRRVSAEAIGALLGEEGRRESW